MKTNSNIKTNTYNIFFTNLANPLRVKIISALKEKARNVTGLSKDLNVEQSKISHSLKLLRHCNIVNVKQSGKERVYSLNKKTIVPILKIIDNHSKTFCGGNCIACGK